MRIVFGAPRIAGLTQAQGFGWSVEETPLAGGSVVTPGSTFADITYSKVDLTGVTNNCRIHVADSYLEPGHSFNSLTPEIATVDSDGNVTRVSNGLAEIIVSTPRAGAKRFTRTMSTGSSSTTAQFEAFGAGSLGAHCVAQIKAMIAGKTPGSATQRYWSSNSGGVASPSGSRNAVNFAAGIDLSGMSMCMTGRDTEKFPVMLISSRHAITARHVCPSAGTVVVFQRADGSFQSVTIAAVHHFYTADLSVVYFSSDVTGITPFKTMPFNFAGTYAPSLIGGPAPYIPHAEWPALQKNVWNPAGQSESWLAVSNCTNADVNYAHNVSPADADLRPWYNWVRGGDSGSPQFFVVNGEPILMTCHSTASISFSIAYSTAEINTAMNTLAGTVDTYALVHPNLSGFNTY